MLGLKNILAERGINPSYQRLKILEYLLNTKTHPTVDTIYQDILKEIPTLSKTTVYNTLKTFIEKGIVMTLLVDDNEVRYDAKIEFHAHLICNTCEGLYDVNIAPPIKINNIINGHEIIESQLYLKGICKNCLTNNKQNI
ncbi:MAG: Fur family transcriptional regulator [Spirochaetota bacterium]|nr:Fur family transcriptional regulator [Spirochaetota bacterium]